MPKESMRIRSTRVRAMRDPLYVGSANLFSSDSRILRTHYSINPSINRRRFSLRSFTVGRDAERGWRYQIRRRSFSRTTEPPEPRGNGRLESSGAPNPTSTLPVMNWPPDSAVTSPRDPESNIQRTLQDAPDSMRSEPLQAPSPRQPSTNNPCQQQAATSLVPLAIPVSSTGGVAPTAALDGNILPPAAPELLSHGKGAGYTAWYHSISDAWIEEPPRTLPTRTGDLYIHLHRGSGEYKIWLFDKYWVAVKEGCPHPVVADRVLHVRSTGNPSWVSANTLAAYNSRARKGIRAIYAGTQPSLRSGTKGL